MNRRTYLKNLGAITASITVTATAGCSSSKDTSTGPETTSGTNDAASTPQENQPKANKANEPNTTTQKFPEEENVEKNVWGPAVSGVNVTAAEMHYLDETTLEITLDIESNGCYGMNFPLGVHTEDGPIYSIDNTERLNKTDNPKQITLTYEDVSNPNKTEELRLTPMITTSYSCDE